MATVLKNQEKITGSGDRAGTKKVRRSTAGNLPNSPNSGRNDSPQSRPTSSAGTRGELVTARAVGALLASVVAHAQKAGVKVALREKSLVVDGDTRSGVDVFFEGLRIRRDKTGAVEIYCEELP